jgi:hypothetical protein
MIPHPMSYNELSEKARRLEAELEAVARQIKALLKELGVQ